MPSTPTAQTLTLQLIFDPTNRLCKKFGRFLPDDPSHHLTERSDVWILNIDTNPVIQPGQSASVTVLSADPNTPLIQILIIGKLPPKWAWRIGKDGYAARITSVFGRAHHANERKQTFATPFSLHNGDSTELSTVFDQTYGTAVNPIGTNNQCLISLGFARFHTAPAPVLTSISPTTFTSQSPAPFTIVGANLPDATLEWSSGTTASGITVSATQITGLLHAANVNAPTSGSVLAVVDSKTSNSLLFTIIPSPDLPQYAGAETVGRATDHGANNPLPVDNDIYEFNVGLKVFLTDPYGGQVELTMGHDPDIDVGL